MHKCDVTSKKSIKQAVAASGRVPDRLIARKLPQATSPTLPHVVWSQHLRYSAGKYLGEANHAPKLAASAQALRAQTCWLMLSM